MEQLKTHEIANKMLVGEYDLAHTIMNGMHNLSQQGVYKLERFKFKST